MIKEQLIRVNPGHAQPLYNQPREALRPRSSWETEPIEQDASLPPHFQGLSSPPARYSSPANTPLSLRTPLAPPRPPRPRGPKPIVKIFANSHGTSSTATTSSDVLPSASPRYAHAPTAVEGPAPAPAPHRNSSEELSRSKTSTEEKSRKFPKFKFSLTAPPPKPKAKQRVKVPPLVVSNSLSLSLSLSLLLSLFFRGVW